MRIFGFLALVIILAIVLIQYKNSIVGTGYNEKGTLKTEEVENRVNQSVSDYQKKLEQSLNQSGAGN
jgi:hypothetical protein